MCKKIEKLVEIAGYEPPPEITVTQAAVYLGVSAVSLHQMRLKGKGPSCYKKGNRILYKPSSLREFIKEVNSKNKSKKNRRVA